MLEMTVPPFPEGLIDRVEYDSLEWGFKFVAVDLTTSDHRGGRFCYMPGTWVDADPGDKNFTLGSACPAFPGDGVCVARSLSGAQSGGQRVGNSAMLQVGYRLEDVLASDADKVRVSSLFVHPELVDPVRLILWVAKSGAYLRSADLSGAYLSGGDLSGAYLSGAYLSGADLRSADLGGAYLRSADLSGADLSGADLRSAYLRSAYLSGAYVGDSRPVLPDGWIITANGYITEAPNA